MLGENVFHRSWLTDPTFAPPDGRICHRSGASQVCAGARCQLATLRIPPGLLPPWLGSKTVCVAVGIVVMCMAQFRGMCWQPAGTPVFAF